jgi:hypothetical protein
MAVARLKSAADLEILPVYRDGVLTDVKVRVKNIRAGHNLPTSLTNVRQMWLDVVVRDERGKVLVSSGQLDEHGHLTANTRLFNSDGMGRDFHFSIDPWVVTSFSRHDTIPPHGYRDVYYGMPPLKSPQRITFEAKLRYRQAAQEEAESLLAAVPADINLETIYGLKKVPPLPIVDMAQKEMTITTQK